MDCKIIIDEQIFPFKVKFNYYLNLSKKKSTLKEAYKIDIKLTDKIIISEIIFETKGKVLGKIKIPISNKNNEIKKEIEV